MSPSRPRAPLGAPDRYFRLGLPGRPWAPRRFETCADLCIQVLASLAVSFIRLAPLQPLQMASRGTWRFWRETRFFPEVATGPPGHLELPNFVCRFLGRCRWWPAKKELKNSTRGLDCTLLKLEQNGSNETP